jgi:hypothetical protein
MVLTGRTLITSKDCIPLVQTRLPGTVPGTQEINDIHPALGLLVPNAADDQLGGDLILE